ncbi:MAG: hypothetical protein AB7O78_19480 [Thermoleophilia bacterium]
MSTVARNLRRIRTTTWTLADAAGLRLSVCPPPEVHDCDLRLGTVTRDVYIGETIRIPVRLRNRSGRGRRLILTAGPFAAEDGATAPAPTVDPGIVLMESESGLVTVGVEVTPVFQPGREYVAVVTVSSRCCDPQELRVRLRVRPDGRCPTFDVCCGGADEPGPCGERRGRTAR